MCKLADVSKNTLNKLSPDTASRVLGETLPQGTKPLQALPTVETVRAIHGASYTRLYNADLLTMVREFATDFVPPQPAGIDGNRPSVCVASRGLQPARSFREESTAGTQRRAIRRWTSFSSRLRITVPFPYLPEVGRRQRNRAG